MKYPFCLIAIFLMTSRLHAQASMPATTSEALRIIITGVEGNVEARTGPDQPWKKATVDMELTEGAELRTGIRSAVQFTIPPDQTITLDRLGTLQILRANFENGKIITDLGMKYGRTRYDIDAKNRPHDAKVHSPSATLAVRGTHANLYDQPPFASEATSLDHLVFFKDIKKEVSFGGQGKAKITTDNDSAANYAKSKTGSSPRGEFSGNSQSDDALQLYLSAYGGSDLSNLGVLAFLDQAKAGTFKGTVTGVLPTPRQLFFALSWFNGDAFNDVNLSVRTPTGQVISTNDPNPPSNVSLQPSVGDQSGSGSESIVFFGYAKGKYTYTATLQSGQTADAVIGAIDDPDNLGITLGFKSGTLTQSSPTISDTVSAPGTSSVSPQQVAKPKSKPVQSAPASGKPSTPAKPRAAR